jgi:hypothetical protein
METIGTEPLTCPVCGTGLGVRHVRFPHFKCPACGIDLKVPGYYRLVTNLIGAVVSVAVCYLVGLRSFALVVVAAVLSLVVGSVVTASGLPNNCTVGILVSVHRHIGFLGGKGALSELAVTNSRGGDNPRRTGPFAKRKSP